MSIRPASLVLGACIALLALLAGAAIASAARDRTPPKAPGNLRATAVGQTFVSLAWDASSDNSGNFGYVVKRWGSGSWVTLATLPKTQTTYTATGLLPNVQYHFWVEAVDAAGNRSGSNLLSVTTLRDTSPPAAPANLRVTAVTASSVSLAWDAAADDTGIAQYSVFVNGNAYGVLSWTGATSVDVLSLAPASTYSFQVQARDLGYNLSPLSSPVAATTTVSTDTQPPSAPTNLYAQNWDCEVELNWTQSTDNQDAQAALRYDVYINGAPDPLGGSVYGGGRTITYGVVNGDNTFVVRAVDSAGNVSAPSNAVTLNLPCP